MNKPVYLRSFTASESEAATWTYPWSDMPSEPLPAEVGFSQAEQWAWSRISTGQDVDMTNGPDGDRRLSGLFIQTILFYRPWSKILSRPIARFIGATITDHLDGESREFDGKIEFRDCHFAGTMDLRGLTVRRSLIFARCRFDKPIIADRMTVGGLMILEGCQFAGRVQMDDLRVETDLVSKGALFDDIWSLDDGHVQGSVYLGPDSTYRGRVDARRLTVEKNLELSGAAFEREVSFVGAEINGELLLDARMRKGKEQEGDADLPRSQRPRRKPEWVGRRAKLNLRNVRAEILQSSMEAWRRKDGKFVARDLTGFTFNRLGGGENRFESLHRESKHALVAWLEKDLLRDERNLPNNGYSPARYRALASTLRDTGHENKARYVLWALGRARKRSLPPFSFSKLIDSLSGQITGYGYQQIRGVFYAAALIGGFSALGMFWPAESAIERDWTSLEVWTSWLGFSFEKAVPFSDLDPIQDTFLQDHFGEDLPRGMRAAFMAERVLGITIIGFAIAGFNGWAERRGQ